MNYKDITNQKWQLYQIIGLSYVKVDIRKAGAFPKTPARI